MILCFNCMILEKFWNFTFLNLLFLPDIERTKNRIALINELKWIIMDFVDKIIDYIEEKNGL